MMKALATVAVPSVSVSMVIVAEGSNPAAMLSLSASVSVLSSSSSDRDSITGSVLASSRSRLDYQPEGERVRKEQRPSRREQGGKMKNRGVAIAPSYGAPWVNSCRHHTIVTE